jgi:hypothetical protein
MLHVLCAASLHVHVCMHRTKSKFRFRFGTGSIWNLSLGYKVEHCENIYFFLVLKHISDDISNPSTYNFNY